MSVLVVAPHPDDETLGCGGTLLRHIAEGTDVHWLILTGMSVGDGYAEARVVERAKEIEAVHAAYGFASRDELAFPPAGLDTVPRKDLVSAIAEVVARVQPTELLVPWHGDAHSDHRVTFDAATACAKPFRHPTVRRVLAYETPSETDFGLDPARAFVPSVFVDVTAHVDRQLEILALYEGESAPHPFPRSPEGIRALATVRGSVAGCRAAEAFVLLRELR